MASPPWYVGAPMSLHRPLRPVMIFISSERPAKCAYISLTTKKTSRKATGGMRHLPQHIRIHAENATQKLICDI